MRRMFWMAVLAAAPLLSGLTLTSGEARAWGHEPYPWCAVYDIGRSGGGTNCGFDTLAQCRATISGVGGTCQPNQFYPEPARRRLRKKRHS